MVMSLVWQLFEPLLFGLVGAEVSIEYMNTKVVGEFSWEDFQTFVMCGFIQQVNIKREMGLPVLRKEQSCCFKHCLGSY